MSAVMCACGSKELSQEEIMSGGCSCKTEQPMVGCGSGCSCASGSPSSGGCSTNAGAWRIRLDDGEEVNCEILGRFNTYKHEYIALLPDKTEDVLIYRYAEQNGGINLGVIESVMEQEQVDEAFDEFLFEMSM